MADTKITDLSELTTLDDADVLPIVDDTTGTPVTKKIEAGTIRQKFAGELTAQARAMQLFDKITQIGAGSAVQLSWMSLGDSLAYRVVEYICDRMRYAYGGEYYGKWGKFGTGSDTLTYALDGSGSQVTDDFDYWINGVYYSLSSGTSDALRAYADGATVVADEIKVYYIKEPGAGTFKVQTSDSAINSGFADEVGYTAIDCDDTLAGGVVTISKTIGKYAVKVAPTSGTVKIIGVGFRISGEPGFEQYSFEEGGIDVVNFATTPSAIVDPIFTDLDPDIISLQADDDSSDMGTAADTLNDWLTDNSLTSTVLIIGNGPKSAGAGGDSVSIAANAVLREKCESYGWLFVDLMDMLGDYTTMTTMGWEGDGTHLNNKAYQYAANQIMHRFGWPDKIFGRLDRPLQNDGSGDDANRVRDIAFYRDPYTIGQAGRVRAEAIFGYDLEIILGRYLSIQDDSSNEYLRVNNSGILEFHATMGDSALDPTSDAPADWVQIKIGSSTYYIPVYAAS